MSSALLDQPLVLLLNRAWQAIGQRTVKQALIALSGGDATTPSALGLDVTYADDGTGGWDHSRPLALVPRPWREWVRLPVRPGDHAIRTPRLVVRVPTVIVVTRFDRMPLRAPRLSRQAIFERDGGICQYTGERVGRSGGNLDHVVPRHRGGADTFENLVWAKREINAFKANRLPHEAGLRLLRPPRAPRTLPAAAAIREIRHHDWRHFLPG